MQPERRPPTTVPKERRPEDVELLDQAEHLLDEIDDILEEGPVNDERGGIPLAVMILIGGLVFMVVAFGLCGDALFEDEDEANDLGVAELSSHDYCTADRDGCGDGYYDDEYEDEDDERKKCTAFVVFACGDLIVPLPGQEQPS